MLLDILPFAHELLRQKIAVGDCVMDATAGNGHDTVLLAQCVGQAGRVFAFDIQAAAIEATYMRLQQQGLLERVHLIQDGHQFAERYIQEPLAAAVFNLGYLPNGDKSITTLAQSSLAAIETVLRLLVRGGLLVVVVYHGHEAGKIEKVALLNYFETLPTDEFRVLRYGHMNRVRAAPFVIAVEKVVAFQAA